MGVETGVSGPIFATNWNRDTNVKGVATDNNTLSHLIEYFAQTLFKEVCENGIVMASPERCQFNASTKRITAPSAGYPVLGMIGGRPFRMTSAMEESSTADSGSSTNG